MAQPQQESTTMDPATQAFVADRQIFWNRFTSFTTGSVIVIVVLVVAMWLFLA